MQQMSSIKNSGCSCAQHGDKLRCAFAMRRSLSVYRLLCGALCLLSLGTPLRAHAQSAVPAVAHGSDIDDSSMLAEDMLMLNGPETSERGINASVAFNSVYDQQLDWAIFVQPAISYRLNSHFSADATIPYYVYRLSYKYKAGRQVTNNLVPRHRELGDTTVAAHAEFSPGPMDETLTSAFNLPTGNTTFGLSTGRVTYLVQNDLGVTVGHLTPDLQLGIGDSSNLVNRRVLKNYDTLGTLAYFQVGAMYQAGAHLNLAGDLYEQLPLGNQKVYTQVKRKGKTVEVQQSNGDAEDNGATITLDIPPRRHWEFSTYFSRSFRLADSTVGLAVTLWAKNP